MDCFPKSKKYHTNSLDLCIRLETAKENAFSIVHIQWSSFSFWSYCSRRDEKDNEWVYRNLRRPAEDGCTRITKMHSWAKRASHVR